MRLDLDYISLFFPLFFPFFGQAMSGSGSLFSDGADYVTRIYDIHRNDLLFFRWGIWI